MRNSNQISVVVVNSRGKSHPDWVALSLDSANKQCKDVVVVDNIENNKTIGKCFNEGVSRSSGDWILFLGDDDYLANGFINFMDNAIDNYRDKKPDAISTYMTVFDGNKTEVLKRPHTGLWRKEYLLKHKFNEELKSGIDSEFLARTLNVGCRYILIPYYFGYFYRQHTDERCAGTVTIDPEEVDVYFVCSNPIFIDPLKDRLREEGYKLAITEEFNPHIAEKAKVIWCEWAETYAVQVANYSTDAYKILNIRAYEAFNNIVEYIDYEKFDKILFTSEYIRDYLTGRIAKSLPHSEVVKNGVQLEKYFVFPNKEHNNKIAYAGYLTKKKGIQLLKFIADNLPHYEFHVAGRFQERDIEDWLNKTKSDNMFLYPWQNDLNDFYKDKTYVINCSPRESLSLATLEGMACGCKPLVYRWLGADSLYSGFVYDDIPGLKALLSSEVDSGYYRSIVERDFNYNDIYEKFKGIIGEGLHTLHSYTI